jgi:hypothetical protein
MRVSLGNSILVSGVHGTNLSTRQINTGGERAAAIYTLLGTAKLNGLDPELYLRQVLERIADHSINRIYELLPWNITISQPISLKSQMST